MTKVFVETTMSCLQCSPDSVLFEDCLTAAVLMIDDDLLIAASDVEFAFHTWQVHIHLLYAHIVYLQHSRRHVQLSLTAISSADCWVCCSQACLRA